MIGASTGLAVLVTVLATLSVATLVATCASWMSRRRRRARERDRERAIVGADPCRDRDASAQATPEGDARRQRRACAREARARERATLLALRERAGVGRWSRRAPVLHRVPWIAVLGGEGAGVDALVRRALAGTTSETMAPDASAVPTLPGLGRWRVGDRAVWIDWPSHPTGVATNTLGDDLARWRRWRARRPVDVVVLAVDAGRLLEGPRPALLASAAALGRHWRALTQRLGVRCPVQVVITHCDRLAGFDLCFADLSRERRRGVWGIDAGVDPVDGRALSLTGLDDLVQRLQARRLERLADERSLAAREAWVIFPSQVAALRHALPAWWDAVLDAAAPLARHLSDDAPTLAGIALVSQGDERSPATFADDLLQQVLPGLASRARPTARALRRRRLVWAAGTVAACGLVVAAGLLRWNRIAVREQALDGVAREAALLSRQVSELPADQGEEPGVVWPTLGTAERLQALLRDPPTGSAWLAWRDMGLDDPDRLRQAVAQVEQRVVQQALWPRVLARIERRAREAVDRQSRYEALRMERLMRAPAHGLPGALGAWWRTSSADPGDAMGRAMAARDAERLDSHAAAHPPTALQDEDPASLEDWRRDASRSSLPDRVLARLRASDPPAEGFRPDLAAGPRGALLFSRASGAPWSQALPAWASPASPSSPGAAPDRVAAVARDVATEARWVLGDVTPDTPPERIADVVEEVRRRQAVDAITAWDAWLADLQIVDTGDIAGALQAIRVISDEPSPWRQLTAGIAKATQAPPQGSNPTSEDALDAHFEPLRRMLAGSDASPSALDRVLAGLRELGVQLGAALQASRQGLDVPPETPAVARLRAEIDDLPAPWRQLLASLVARASNRVGATGARQLGAAIAGESGALCRQALAGRYPMVPDAASDVPPGDFVTLFAPEGLFDREVRTRLGALVDTTQSPWRVRAGVPGADSLSPATLASLQRAAAIRDAFFPAGGAQDAGAAATGELSLASLDDGVAEARVIVDGVAHVMSTSTPSALRVSWHARGPGSRMQLALAGVQGGAAVYAGPTYEGAWALFRWIDAGTPRVLAPERLQLRYGPPGHGAVFELRADSVRNPWRLADLRGFRCPS